MLDSGIDLLCPNTRCPGRVKEGLRYFCGRGQMDIEGLGDVLVDQLVERGLVKTFADLYKLKADDIANLESEVEQGDKVSKRTVGEKIAAKVIANIENSRKQGLDRLLAALGIPHVGSRVAFILAQHFGSLEALSKATAEDFSAVNDIGDVIAKSVHGYFHEEPGRQIVADLHAVGFDPQMEKPAAEDQPLAGKSVVVTGTLETFDRKGIEDLILKLGGKASGSVSKKTSFLVAGENAGSKLDKAKSLGVEVISEKEFVKRYGK